MKLRNVEDPKELLNLIDTCEGKVELITSEGDRLNLKSKLCQYVSLATVFSSEVEIPEMEIVAYEPEDIKKLMNYLVNGER